MPTYIPIQRLPQAIELGVDQTVSFDVVDSSDTDTSLTATAGTYTLLDGDEVVIAETAVSSLGPPASYDIVAADTSDRALSSRLLEIWQLTLSGREETFHRPAYLVRRAFRSTVTDADLLAHDPTLTETVPAGTTFDTERTRARERIERDLLKKNRRPELIFDIWALHDAELALTLSYIYRGQASALSDGRYAQEAKARMQEYLDEMDSIKFRYDKDKSGTITDASRESASTLVLATGSGRAPSYGAGLTAYSASRIRRRR